MHRWLSLILAVNTFNKEVVALVATAWVALAAFKLIALIVGR